MPSFNQPTEGFPSDCYRLCQQQVKEETTFPDTEQECDSLLGPGADIQKTVLTPEQVFSTQPKIQTQALAVRMLVVKLGNLKSGLKKKG